MSLVLAIAQLKLPVGDLTGNADRIIDTALRARDEMDCNAIVFPELALTGYPPEDLLFRQDFLDQCETELARVGRSVSGIAVILGHPARTQAGLTNAVSVLENGICRGRYAKHRLPNHSVFDEKRYFVPGQEACVVELAGVPLGLTICEDIWQAGPVAQAAAAGARMVININASPFHINKRAERLARVAQEARDNAVAIAYVNLVGGQDELVFDGESFVVTASGEMVDCAPSFRESLHKLTVTAGPEFTIQAAGIHPPRGEEESVYEAIVLGVRDYIEKNGFDGAVIGLSGGIDSALTLTLAVDAIGADAVEAVLMPSRYTSAMSLEDAQIQARALGVATHNISIEPMFEAFLSGLTPVFADLPSDTSEENIQARCRGVLLMAISNKKRKIVLTTGNKSEMAVGYATLYGDMAGGFAAIRDVPKTLVYRLARYRNNRSAVIPERVLTRAPTAELAPDQKDCDSLPAYEILDPILEMYIERDCSAADIVAAGFDEHTVAQVLTMIERNEYKRRQAAPGVRISRRAFGRDRRYPISSAFRSAAKPAH